MPTVPDSNNILAGVGAGGTAGTSLAWFGLTSATAPASAVAALTGFQDAGYCSTAGLTIGNAVSSTPLQAFGTLAPVRVLVTSQIFTFKVTFLESSTTALEVYHRQALNALVPTAGAFTVTDGVYSRQLYSAVFDMVDGVQHLRVYCPIVEVTDVDDIQVSFGQPVEYGVTLTAYPNTAGVVAKTFYVVTDDAS
jgi:hypothetical protein